ncbi:ATP-binding protein [Clostridioides difficile]
MINNLLQNIITHSSGNKMTLRIFENKEQAQIIITDNGKGISNSYSK